MLDWLVFTTLRSADYVLLSLGFALVFGVGRVLNLAHGAFFLLAAYIAYLAAGLGPFGAGAVSVVAVSLSGAAVFYGLLRPVAQDPDRCMVRCLALNLVVMEGARLAFGANAVSVPGALEGSLELVGVTVSAQSLLAVPAALLTGFATWWVASRTHPGRAIRAVAEDAETARLLGIDPTATLGATFVASSALVALAACLLTPDLVVTPQGWVAPLVKSFAIVVLAGRGSLGRVFGAAVLLAAAEVATSLWWSESLAELVGLVVILAVLLKRGAERG